MLFRLCSLLRTVAGNSPAPAFSNGLFFLQCFEHDGCLLASRERLPLGHFGFP